MFYKGERGSVIILREISFEAMIQIMFCGMWSRVDWCFSLSWNASKVLFRIRHIDRLSFEPDLTLARIKTGCSQCCSLRSTRLPLSAEVLGLEDCLKIEAGLRLVQILSWRFEQYSVAVSWKPCFAGTKM
jgi:hypothetical protein